MAVAGLSISGVLGASKQTSGSTSGTPVAVVTVSGYLAYRDTQLDQLHTVITALAERLACVSSPVPEASDASPVTPPMAFVLDQMRRQERSTQYAIERLGAVLDALQL